MYIRSKGIVIRCTRYAESSLIANIFTEEVGLCGFIIPSAYKPKAKISASLFQPLTVLDLYFSESNHGKLARIKEVNCLKAVHLKNGIQQSYYHIYSEILRQILRENETNPDLFAFISQELIPNLYSEEGPISLEQTMGSLLTHIGCAPYTGSYDEGYLLDLQEGCFISPDIHSHHTCSNEESRNIYELLMGDPGLKADKQLRLNTISTLCKYYKIHLNEAFELKSLDILMQVNR